MLADFQGSVKRPVFCLCLNSSCPIQFLVYNRPIISVCRINKVHCWLGKLGQGNENMSCRDWEILTPGLWRLGKRRGQQLLQWLCMQGATKTQLTNRPWWLISLPMQVWLKFRLLLLTKQKETLVGGGETVLVLSLEVHLGPESSSLRPWALSDRSRESQDSTRPEAQDSGQRPNS